MAGSGPRKGLQYFSLMLSFGATLVVAMYYGYRAGQWLDARFGTAPWLALVGIMMGVTVGFRHLVRELLRAEKLDRDNGGAR